MILTRSLAAALVLVASAGTAGCTAAASAALGVALNIAVRATELDTAVIENFKARQTRAAPPSSIPR